MTSSETSPFRKDDMSGKVNEVPPCSDPSCHEKSQSWLEWFRKRKPSVIPPPDRGEIGRAGWLMIHTTTAQYPLQPSREQQTQMASWLKSFAHLYPCSICRTGFIKVMESLPPRIENRNSLVLWSCEAHNKVNADIGLPQYPCDLACLLTTFGRIVNESI